LARLLRALRAILFEHRNAVLQQLQGDRLIEIALKLKLRDRILTLCTARMPRHKDQFAIGGAGGIPFQIILRVDRLAVLVNAEQRHIQVVARIREIVGVAAEEGGLVFGCEYQPHIGILPITVKPVFAALIQRHDVGTQARLLQAFAFDPGDGGFAPSELLCRRHGAFQRRLHSLGHVLHGPEHVDLQVRRLHLLRGRGRVEAVLDKVVLGGGVFLQLAARYMVIGEQQAMRADERAGAAVVQAHAGEAHVIQPLRGGCEMILLFQLLDGRVVECPHALVGAHGKAGCEQDAEFV